VTQPSPFQPQPQQFPTSGPFAPQAPPAAGTFPYGGAPAPAQAPTPAQFQQAPGQPAPGTGQWTQPPAQAPGGAPTPWGAPAPPPDRGPRVRDIYGRLLLISPKKIETVVNRLSKVPGEMQDRMTVDIVVLDGGPLAFGGAPEATPPKPHDRTVEIPYLIEGLWMSQVGLVSQCREALANKLSGLPGKQTMVLGRLSVSEDSKPGQNPAYLLLNPTPEDGALATAYISEHPPIQPFQQR
jgi:hypothetical protein